MLALVRYVTMCTDITSCTSRYTRDTQIIKTCFFVLLAVLLPAIAWTCTLYVGSPASGRMFYFIPTTNSTDLISITASQNVKENERGNSRLLLIILTSVLAIQLILTLLISAKIFCISYKSTLNLVLKKDKTTDINLPIIEKQNKGNNFSNHDGKKDQSPIGKKSDYKSHNDKGESIQQKIRDCGPNENYTLKESIECITLDSNDFATDDQDAIAAIPDDIVRRLPHINSPDHTQNGSSCTRKSRAILLLTAEEHGNSTSGKEDYKVNVSIAKENDGNNLNQNDDNGNQSPNDKTLGNKHHNKNSESSQQKKPEGESNAKYNPKKSIECIISNPSGYVTDDPDAITAIPDDILCCNPQLNSPDDTQNDIRSTRKTRAILLPSAEDYDNSTSVTGIHKIPVPLTKVVLCLSNSDITCSISLTLQLICLCITHMLTVFTFRIAGQEVSLERYMQSVYSMEVALLINTMVDPIVCVVFSSDFRNAVKAIISLRRSP